MTETIFDRAGGFAKVSRIVSSFYDRVLDSPVLAPYFVGVDMRRQIDHQTKFVAFLMGGPASYTAEHLGRVHERLRITEDAFAELTEILRETFEDFGLDETDISAINSRVLAYRPVIVTRPATIAHAPETP